MKRTIIYYSFLMLGAVSMLASCTKDAAKSSNATISGNSALASAVASTGSIAIAAINASGTPDSLYLVGCVGKHGQKDTIALNSLPTTITAYLTANYSGYDLTKAFQVKDSLSVVTNYVVVIIYNGSYIGLNFKADGAFVNVLEQRIGDDLKHNRRFHEGGPFGDRGGNVKDTLAISAIPANVASFFKTSYAADTLLHAFATPDSTYVLISRNNGLYATAITSAGSLIKRALIDALHGNRSSVTAAGLPASVTIYLSNTYVGYVFNKAYSINTRAGVLLGYDVFITVNNTRYVVAFNATGTLIAFRVLR